MNVSLQAVVNHLQKIASLPHYDEFTLSDNLVHVTDISPAYPSISCTHRYMDQKCVLWLTINTSVSVLLASWLS